MSTLFSSYPIVAHTTYLQENAPVSKEEEIAIVAVVAENRAAAASLAVSMAMTPVSSIKAINPPSMEETRMNISKTQQKMIIIN